MTEKPLPPLPEPAAIGAFAATGLWEKKQIEDYGRKVLEISDADLKVAQASYAVMSRALSDLVGACLDADGKPKAPTKKDLMRARSMLPPRFAHALGKEQPR
jgi:hypothetical protein